MARWRTEQTAEKDGVGYSRVCGPVFRVSPATWDGRTGICAAVARQPHLKPLFDDVRLPDAHRDVRALPCASQTAS